MVKQRIPNSIPRAKAVSFVEICINLYQYIYDSGVRRSQISVLTSSFAFRAVASHSLPLLSRDVDVLVAAKTSQTKVERKER